ncbi:hypothetical protein [Sulfitobacter sp. R18_1]|uniref:hypothetical protein n=1 Tax=Sulfitobacter sp. R18_1 TaxID=2821104 RepID=UPI001AD9CA3D|nr:hypothetical protein [Sulfitobacter sp. R18_1]MBO9427964.1 hypothetical protein [Sulfitobacter sp. R18_1]
MRGNSEIESVWDDHPKFPARDWEREVVRDETRLGYINWLEERLGNELTDQGEYEHWAPEGNEEFEEYPVADWSYEVQNGDTRAGYVDYVNTQIEMYDPPSP